MSVSRAKGRFIFSSPRKVRSVARLVKGESVLKAQAVLAQLPKRACKPIAKVLNSAVANATRTGAWAKEQLFISRILADEGPKMKRFRAGAMGRGMGIRKRMCHLLIELDSKEVRRGA
ncbi:MAG: 50S ribosomal protein L22 [Candidatus Omnitrophica bacterium]|nr:50S ribosomal protein L22 [Candidatus Omnitrophota bacterium]